MTHYSINNFFNSKIQGSAMDLSTGVTLGELMAVLVPNYSPKIRNITISNYYLNSINLLETFYNVFTMTR